MKKKISIIVGGTGQFGISLTNVLDEDYESPHGFSQEGRKLTLGFNKSF